MKFWLPELLAQQAIRFAEGFVRPDPSCGGNLRQDVTSLYLDTPRLDFYQWHLASSPDRFKLRVRFYGRSPGSFAFFEVKRKVGTVVDKRRARIASTDVIRLLESGAAAMPALDAQQAEHLRRFLCLAALHRATPRLLLRCSRETYVSTQPGDKSRLTVDRDISYQPVSTATLVGDPERWRPAPVPRSGALLELKLAGAVPFWMLELARRLASYRQPYSKYVAAVSAVCGSADGRMRVIA